MTQTCKFTSSHFTFFSGSGKVGTIIHEDYIKPIYIYTWNQQIEYSNRPKIPWTSPSFDVMVHLWFDEYYEVQQDHIESWINKLKVQVKSVQ